MSTTTNIPKKKVKVVTVDKTNNQKPISVSRKRKQKEPGWIEYFKAIAKNCVVPFGELFENPNFDKYKFFKIILVSKKIYTKLITGTCEVNNNILNYNRDIGNKFIYKYFLLKKALDDGKYFGKKELFVTNLLRELFDVEMLQNIRNYVDANYKTKINPEYEQNKDGKYESGPMFLANHYKIFHMCSIMSNLVIPLAIQFIQKNPQEKIDVSNFLMEILVALLKYAESGTNTDVYQKLYRLVEKRVNVRMGTDGYGIKLQEIYGVTKGSIIDDIIVKLLTTIVPKLSFDGDIIVLMEVVIKCHLDVYLLRGKFNYTAKPTALDDAEGTSNGDEGGNEAEIFESYNSGKRDEKIHLLRNLLPQFVIRDIENIYQIDYLPGEIDFYMATMEQSRLQELLLSQVFSKDFGGTDNLGGINKIEFFKLCIILAKRMRRFDINLLADYLTGKKNNTILTRYQYRNIHKKLQAHPMYEEVIKKYNGVNNLFTNKIANRIDKNPIMENLIQIFNNNYVKNTYMDTDNGKPLPKVEDVIMDEMLKMYNLLIY